MCPTLPKDSFEERRLPRFIVPSLLITAAAVFYFFYKKHKLINGIDTPVVITGGSLTLFSDTPFTAAGYEVDPDGMQISHKKDKNKIVHITVVDYSPLPEIDCDRLREGDYNFPGIIPLYDKKVERGCDVKVFYTPVSDEASVQVSSKSNGKGLKIKFKRKRFDEYHMVDDQTRQHPDGDNRLTRVEIKNGPEPDVVVTPFHEGKCGIRFTYED